jgi:hypothetical protein
MAAESFEYDRFGGGVHYRPDYIGERVRLRNARHCFIRFHGRWEFYVVLQSGESRGLEMFAGYVERPEHVEVLERAVRIEEQRAAAREWERKALQMGAEQ